MEVWLLESIYDDYYAEILLHIKGSNIWITDVGYDQERLEDLGDVMNWNFDDRDNLTKIGTF